MAEPARKPLVYFDANPLVYAVEGDEVSATPTRLLLDWLRKRPGLAATSELSLAEVLPKVSPEVQQGYFDLIVWSGIFDLQPVTRDVRLDTVRYRKSSIRILPDGRESMTKLPDAIHVVTALRTGCRKFLSKDAGLRMPAECERVAPDAAGISKLIAELERT